MSRIIGVLVLSLTALFCGCGSGSNGAVSHTQPSMPPPPPPTATVNGNWAMHLSSQSASGIGVNDGGGYFTTSGSAVSGAIHFLPSSCFYTVEENNDYLDAISMTGTITSSGDLTLTSSPVQGAEVLTINGIISGNTLNGGTYSIAGGCADGDSGTVSGWAASPLGGTYKGSFLSKSGLTIGTSVSITQASQPSSDGIYSASGNVTFSNSPCFSSGTFSPTDQGDPNQFIFGDFVQVEIETNGAASVIFQGTVDPTGKTIIGTYQVLGGLCTQDSGTGTVTQS
jgi:hypothetical protein